MQKRLLLILVLLSFWLILSPTFAQSLPGPGNSLLFRGGSNGGSTYINAGTNNRGITNQVTAEAWVKTSDLSYMWVIGKYLDASSEDRGYHLVLTGGRAGFYGRVGAGQYMSSELSTTLVSDGRWHHLAGVFKNNTWQIYVDGVLENSRTYSASNPSLTTSIALTIGNYLDFRGQYFNGELDEVRLWRTARTQTEIRENMCRKFGATPADLVAYFQFDQTSGLVALDQGSVPINGTLLNFASGNNPWRLSGAALGDASAFEYQANGSSSLRVQLATATGDLATVLAETSIPDGRGVQLYAVNSAPTIPAGAGAAPTYVGVFTTGDVPTPAGYTLHLSPRDGLRCSSLMERRSNELPWQPGPALATPAYLIRSNATYRGEYIHLTGAAPPRVVISGDSLLCASGPTTLTAAAAGAASYRWSTGATTATLADAGPGTYTVTATFIGGCSTSARRTVRVLNRPAVLITGDSLLCSSASITLTATAAGATAVRWNTGATTAALTVTTPGVYTATLTYGPGCTSTARRAVRAGIVGPAFTLGADTILCQGETTLLRGPAGPDLRYRWSDGSISRTLQVRESGRYTLQVFTNCDEHSASRVVAVQPCLIVVPNIITANRDAHNDLFAVGGLTSPGWQLDVYNRWGKAVLHTTNYANDWGAEAAPGLYYVLLKRPATGYSYRGWVQVVR